MTFVTFGNIAEVGVEKQTSHTHPRGIVSRPIRMANVNKHALADDLQRALRSCVVLDLETTGLDPERERIIEVGALRIEDGTVADSFHALVNPQQSLPSFVVDLTGLDDSQVARAETMDTVLPALERFITAVDQQPILVGHNVNFDISFLAAEAHRAQPAQWGFLTRTPSVCTAESSRQLISRERVGRYKLDNVAAHLNTAHGPSHRALDDAQTTFEVLVGLADLSRRHTPPPA